MFGKILSLYLDFQGWVILRLSKPKHSHYLLYPVFCLSMFSFRVRRTSKECQLCESSGVARTSEHT